MIIFAVLASLLVVVALAFATWPLRRAAPRTAIALIVLVPALVASLYWLKGNPEAIAARPMDRSEQVDSALGELQAATRENPDNLEAWVLLGRMHKGLGQYPQALAAFAKANALAPDEPDLMVEYAEAQMRSSADRRFPPAAVALIERALAINANNQRALFFLGMHQLQGNAFADAAATWEKLLPMLDQETAAALLPQINEARSRAQLSPLPMTATAAGPTLEITVQLDATIAVKPGPGAMLFVFARSENGDGPPVAAKRVPITGFPLQVALSDADSVMPARRLSTQSRVQLMARISGSGSAAPTAGDIEAQPVVVEVKNGTSASLTLSKILP